MTSAPSASRSRAATAVFPDAVGPKSARTLRPSRRGLLEAMLDLSHRACALEGPILLRMRRTPLAEPRDRTRDTVGERRLGLPAEQLACLGHVCDVMRDLAEQRGGSVDLRLDAQLSCDQLRGAHERVALAEREVDRLVGDAPLREGVDTARDAVDAVVDVGEVEHLLVAAEDRDRLAA